MNKTTHRRQPHAVAKLMILIGMLVAGPLVVLPWYPEDASSAASFLLPAFGSIALGWALWQIPTNRPQRETRKTAMEHSALTVVFAWIWASIIGAAPFVLEGLLRPTQALFEAVSGWTTTGLSVLDVRALSHIFLFHRAFMQFCGGLGFVMVMIMLVSDKHSMNLFQAEGHPDKLSPNLRQTARLVFRMYVGFLIAGTALYAMAGMPVFDGITHAMCALSTGGFSTKLASIGEYNSLAIEWISIFLMIIGTINFAALLLIVQRKWKRAGAVSELRFMGLLLILFIPLCAIGLRQAPGMSAMESLRRASFDVVSALSTTGYSTMSYESWSGLSIGVLILMMLIGGGIGSTAGGLKQSRVYILMRLLGSHIRKKLSSARKVETLTFTRPGGKDIIDTELASDTMGYLLCYLVLFFAGSFAISYTERCVLSHAMFEFSSALGTVGLSIGITGPATANPTLIVEMIGMFLGRLEIFIVLTGAYAAVDLLQTRRRARKSASAPSESSLRIQASDEKPHFFSHSGNDDRARAHNRAIPDRQ